MAQIAFFILQKYLVKIGHKVNTITSNFDYKNGEEGVKYYGYVSKGINGVVFVFSCY